MFPGLAFLGELDCLSGAVERFNKFDSIPISMRVLSKNDFILLIKNQ